MQKLKYLLWLVILIILFVFIYQNSDYFMADQPLGIDLRVFQPEPVEFPNLVYYIAVFVIGMLFSFFLSFSYVYKKRKTIREMNETINQDKKRISELESKLEGAEMAAYDKTYTTGATGDRETEKTVDAEVTRI